MQALPPLEMRIELTVIEDLGIKLYTQIAPAISEIVANSWDAEAHNVDIALPIGDIGPASLITVSDDGLGMTYQQIQEKYLIIGRKKREEEGTDRTPNLNRRVIGSKGIGKLAEFGIAQVIEVETVKDHISSRFRMKLDDILRDARTTHTYRPEILDFQKEVPRERGTTVTMRELKRSTPIDIEQTRRTLARHFAILSPDFSVSVNGPPITPLEKFGGEKIERTWAINEPVDDLHPDWRVTGEVIATKEPLDEKDRGVVIMARGKLIQSPTFFDVKVGAKYTYSYLAGEINAEFLDEKEDLISTNRQSVVWESPQGSALIRWGQKKLRAVSEELNDERRTEREKVIREDPEFKGWLESLPKPEAAIADKVITIISANEVLPDERRKELASFMKESFEQKVFKELVATLTENPEDAQILEMFETWDVIEAREILRLVKGRIEVIQQFEKLTGGDTKEIPTLHEFFKKWPWILDPTWTRWQDEVRYSQLLRQAFSEEKIAEADRRIDFVCIGVGDTVHVVELKRPKHRIDSDDLDQLIAYVAFVRERLGTDNTRGYRDAAGYIIGGEISTDRVTRSKIKLIGGGRMYVRRFDDLLVVARQLHAEFEQKLQEFETRKLRNS